MKRGIDVSVFQSGINWERVKASGVDFAMKTVLCQKKGLTNARIRYTIAKQIGYASVLE